MIGLNLGGDSKKKLPASAFPEWADEYFCDNCGREITKQLRRRQSHSWQLIGPERFYCECGCDWETGAAEWDHLSSRERGKRFNAFVVANIVFGVIVCFISLVVYFLSSGTRVALGAGLVVLLLFLLLQLKSWIGVLASICRTRLRRVPGAKQH
jgi:hypothetical protein